MPKSPIEAPSTVPGTETPPPAWDFSALAGLTVHDVPSTVSSPMPTSRASAARLAETLLSNPSSTTAAVADPQPTSTVDPVMASDVSPTINVPPPAKRARKRISRSATIPAVVEAPTPSDALVSPSTTVSRRKKPPVSATVSDPQSVRPRRTSRTKTSASAPTTPSPGPCAEPPGMPIVPRATNNANDALATFLVRPCQHQEPATSAPAPRSIEVPSELATAERPLPTLMPSRDTSVSSARAQRGQASLAAWTDGAWSSATPEEKRHARRVFRILVGLVALILLAVWWASAPTATEPHRLTPAMTPNHLTVLPRSDPTPSVVPPAPRAGPQASIESPVTKVPSASAMPSPAVPMATVGSTSSPSLAHRRAPSRAVPVSNLPHRSLPPRTVLKPFQLDAPVRNNNNAPSIA